MDRGLDWYKRDPIDFIFGIQGIGPDLIGAYAIIVDLLYARAGKMPRDDRHLGGVLGCSTRKAKTLTDQLIDKGKITCHDGFITNSRASQQSKSRRDLSETRATAGRKGGENSAASNKNNDLGQANALSKTQAEEKRREKKKEKDTNVSQKKPKIKPERFQEFWDEYPHRGGTKKARKPCEAKYTAAVQSGVTEEAIILAVKRLKSDKEVKDGFAPDPLTWLTQARWQDEAAGGASKGPTPDQRRSQLERMAEMMKPMGKEFVMGSRYVDRKDLDDMRKFGIIGGDA